ncbi:MAG TPA: Eco57I restriction-modification methylase domain-containing protein [Candidatus Tripitaka californicus]|uniref:Eco57I restriction-modification methylase domain-containing protein n=1 Tax=Candidatus Tripitaka californicus TaxID=3367616 RepID=UPI004025C2A2|nr:N-6 DNA methylase [Planctomycetota bacterium]
MDTSTLRQDIQSLVEKFDRDKHHYLSKDYLEAQTRKDFIDPLFEALGWDISNKAGLPPFEREVLLERGETSGRPDYNFRLGGASKFFVEAKAPPESLDSVRHVLQAKSYAWNTKEVFIAVLTDFEELKVFDASLPPDKKTPLQGLILDLKYTEYLDNLDKLLWLSREAVSQGSLERLLLKDAKSKRQRIPVDRKFLQDMTLWREELAKVVYRHDPSISVRTLNEVVQRLLDRIVFIRIAEDRKIIAPRTLFEIAQLWKAEGRKKPIQYHLNNLFREINADLNGDIFKPHACEQYEADSQLLAEIIENLYFPNSPYLFDVIGVELLGSIYERYLGSTIRATPGGRVKVEEKPEVRKAGGVYYTPQYIVKYIVENTVGKLIEGKTSKQIEKMKILDPACGSGSFLLGAYQYLIDYHIKYYREHPREAHAHPLFPDLLQDSEGNHRLSIIKKGHILRNNLFGVDIDPQAVEITMMSLYLKALEGERTLPRKQGLLPVLSDNIKCGNSLIGYDIFDVSVGATHRVAPTKGQGILVGAGLPHPHITDEERERINPFDWNSKKAGFGEIMERGGFDCVIGNPPYVRVDYMAEQEKNYYKETYLSPKGKYDLYYLFIEKSIMLIKDTGHIGLIVPNKFCTSDSGFTLRKMIIDNSEDVFVNSVSKLNVFEQAANYPILFFAQRNKDKFKSLRLTTTENIVDLYAERIAINLDKRSILKLPRQIFPLNTGKQELAVYFRINKNCNLLEDYLEISEGFRIPIQYECTKGDEHIVKQYQFSRYSPILQGSFIKRTDREKTISTKSARYLNCLKKKIIIAEDALRLETTIDDSKSICQGGVYFGILNDKESFTLEYIVALLNSKLLTFLYKTLFSGMHIGGGYLRFRTSFLNYLPIRTINFDNPKEKAMHGRLVTLVDRMLELQKKRHALPATSGREMVEREIAVTDEKIDDLVYELYGITKEERKIIEGMG